MEVDIPSPSLNSLEANQFTPVHSDVVSAEDVAWADSCLIKDDIFENGFHSHLNALLTRLGTESEPSDAIRGDISPYNREMGTSRILNARFDEKDQSFNRNQVSDENTDIWTSEFNLNNVFLPAYDEKLRDLETKEFDDIEFPGLVTEQSIGDIFKVWNLDLPPEEDDFVKQLKKAVSDSSLEVMPSGPDESNSLKDLEDGNIDDIISGIADISLNFLSI